MGKRKIRQEVTSNASTTTAIMGATTEAKNKRTRKTESSNNITSDITSNKNTSYAVIATNANPAPKRKKNKKPTNGHTNNVVKKAMPDIGHPFFVLERIRATKLANERRASNNINRNSMLNSLNINDSQSQSNLTAFPQAPQSATPQAPVMYLPSFLGPPSPLQPPQYPPTPALIAATASSLSSSLIRRPKFVHTSTWRSANGMPPASTLLTSPTLVHVVPSVTAPAPVLGQAQLPSAIPPTTTADASLVVDLTEDDDAQAIEPYTPPASDRIGDLVEQFQRNLEEKQEEMSMWCAKMTQLMMDAPNLIKAAGQVYGGEAETRALNAAEALSEYGRATLGSCFDACDNVWKIFMGVDGAQTTATTTSASSAAFCTTTIGAADRSR